MMFDRLSAPFPPSAVSWRVGSTTKDKKKGMALAYLDARDVMERLDEVCGPANWQCEYPHAGAKTVCTIGIKIDGEWVWKADGAGDSDVEAEKGAMSDAFKRAAVKWGIGRYLYDLASPWVELDTYERDGKTFAKGIKPSEFRKLEALLGRSGAPARPEQPEPASEADADSRVANTLIGALRMSVDAGELRGWAEENKAAIERLPTDHAHRVRMAYQAHRNVLFAQQEAAE